MILQADIPKPFNNYVGYPYRSSDGSNNSLIFPTVVKRVILKIPSQNI